MPVARWSIRRLYIPCGPHTAARSTNGCCTQPTLRHVNRYTRSLVRAPRLRAWACARIRMFKVT